jgi:hypothetical protein
MPKSTPEQGRHRDRDHVEAPDHQQPGAHRHDQAREGCGENGEDHPAGFQRQIKDHADRQDGQPHMDRGALRDGGEFLVG